MMQLRSTTSIFKLVLGLSVGVVIFIIIQMSYLPGAEKGSQEMLEQRLLHLEGDLSRSRQVAGELHDAIERLMTLPAAPAPAAAPAQGGGGEPPPTAVAESREPADAASLCEFGSQPPGKTDVQMLDVYRDIPFDNPDGGAWKQGWDVTYDANEWSPQRKLKVFVVPHSHNDPGWIKTFEKYYADQTRHIFNSMVNMLEKYPRMRFIWAEISYLDLWWREISPEVKDRVRRLVSRGQLELVTAGWVMHDEANSHYLSILEQLTTGHEWLRLNLNATVSNGWAIDPFGMSPTTAYFLRRSGLDHMVIQRVHYVIKRYLSRHKQLEFWWRQTWDSGDSTDMFCLLMPFYSYDAPHSCGPDPKVCCQFDFARLPGGRYSCPWKVPPVQIKESNVAKRALMLLDQYRKKSQLYASNVLMVPLGDDFRYDSEAEWEAQYTNYQRLFDYMNSRTDWHVEAQFGTLSEYFAALEAESKHTGATTSLSTFPRLSGDFFTYADKNDEYWSGYYTSRPFHKQMDRVLMGELRAAEILYSLSLSVIGGKPSAVARDHLSQLMADLVTARRAFSLFQHHDGITGTAKDRVVIDYGNKMMTALQRCSRVQQQSVQLLLLPSLAGWRPDVNANYWVPSSRRPHADRLPEPSVLQLSTSAARQVALFNSLAHRRAEMVSLHVSAAHVEVTDADGRPLRSQCAPVFAGGRRLPGAHRVTFLAELAPLSLAVFSVRETGVGENSLHSLAEVTLMSPPGVAGVQADPSDRSGPYAVTVAAEPTPVTLESSTARLQFAPDGMLRLVKLTNHDAAPLTVEFVAYGVARGSDMSGAYIFRPDGPARPYRQQGAVRVTRGPLVDEVTVLLPEVEHTVRLSHEGDNAGWVEIENRADVSQQRNFELAMRLSSAIESGDRLVTDLNGFQTIERRTLQKLPIQGNYYPVPSMMYIEDANVRLTLTLGQPLGGASQASGQLEVMLDRRLMQDDNRGAGQGVTDTRRTLSTFRLLLEYPDSQTPPVKPLPSLLAHSALRSLLQPITVLVEGPDLPVAAQPRGAAPPARRQRWSAAVSPAACDLELATLRASVAGGDGGDRFWPGENVTLTVRRVAADCRFPGPPGEVCTAAGKFSVSQLLPKGFQTSVQQVSLTGVHPGSTLTLSTPLGLDPMELYTFRLKLR
ncbi:alpha-mannosidase 2-like [Amphibalanus amphitrite]|uniref:alpha-mannosidase 2-like n=1 Tax=Amphibalanus amphitrite TaxID=1232801 RepID=UPI001C92AEF4|nr:alpha-mannosidase 2-like [Amphibalanus amphitrite]XP_043233336.1 alpha-mannosidase 2-like [Amphibalanus amphitrite]XP_043233337.1 alpha-mannosidase 2-like [Amphibalanus amphitrite]XP_043233338.1 alpha-mannosidase 2-like [Amphibalanus amphitrite]